jgi:hypothetical protein
MREFRKTQKMTQELAGRELSGQEVVRSEEETSFESQGNDANDTVALFNHISGETQAASYVFTDPILSITTVVKCQ